MKMRSAVGWCDESTRPLETRTFLMSFNHGVHWDKALRISAEIEDEELSRRLSMGK